MLKNILLIFFTSAIIVFAQTYPDKFYTYENEELVSRVESLNGATVSADGKSIILAADRTAGSVILLPDTADNLFNRGLPSWNGKTFDDNSGFKILMRYYSNASGWSPWLTVGFWKKNLWSPYGTTSFTNGKIDIDYAQLYTYHSRWQYQVLLKRPNISAASPSLTKLSFFTSDQRTTDNVNISAIVADIPAPIFINTQHFYQYGLDPVIGGSICSPTSVAMVLRSYDIQVNPLDFAVATYDPYWQIYGVWPRAVQHAAEYNLTGAVTRYRSWSEARAVLAAGGRIVMSISLPLYEGHLLMLAGFDNQGVPIVHDPAKSNGYSYKFSKTALSQSWFSRGGVAYTFFQEPVSSIAVNSEPQKLDTYAITAYPNPFNPSTNIKVDLPISGYVEINIYDINGQKVKNIVKDDLNSGSYTFHWNASDLSSGVYLIRLNTPGHSRLLKTLLLK